MRRQVNILKMRDIFIRLCVIVKPRSDAAMVIKKKGVWHLDR